MHGQRGVTAQERSPTFSLGSHFLTKFCLSPKNGIISDGWFEHQTSACNSLYSINVPAGFSIMAKSSEQHSPIELSARMEKFYIYAV